MIGSMGRSLITMSPNIPNCQQMVETRLGNLSTQWRSLDKKIAMSQTQIEDVLSQWTSYNAEFQTIVKLLTETEYSLNKSNLLAGDLAAIKIQMDKLQVVGFT